MMKAIGDYLSENAALSKEDSDFFLERMTRLELKKGHILVKPAQLCNYMYFVEKGITRTYYYKKEKLVTDWLGTEGTFITIVDNFINNTPSKKYLEVLEDSVLWALKNSHFEKLCIINPEIQRFGQMIFHGTLVALQEKFDDLHFLTASERYQRLMDKSPELLLRVPLSIIASYLGISQETLSRIRANAKVVHYQTMYAKRPIQIGI